MCLVGTVSALSLGSIRALGYSAKCGWTCLNLANYQPVKVLVSCPSQYATASCWSGPGPVNPYTATQTAFATNQVYQEFGCYTNVVKKINTWPGDQYTNCRLELS